MHRLKKTKTREMEPTPSAQAFKAALRPDRGFQAVLPVESSARFCSFRRPGCDGLVKGHMRWEIDSDGNVLQWRR